jgi:hypothetical protein
MKSAIASPLLCSLEHEHPPPASPKPLAPASGIGCVSPHSPAVQESERHSLGSMQGSPSIFPHKPSASHVFDTH